MMHFETGHLYHVYNQGNNRQAIFYKADNYLYFLNKIRSHIIPYCDILAWCLMPNHFHLMVRVNKLEAEIQSPSTTRSRTRTENARIDLLQKSNSSDDFLQDVNSHPMSKGRAINQSIAILLRSYTRAINKQEGLSGSLFRQKTKAECLTYADGIQPSFYDSHAGTIINVEQAEKQYPQLCYSYILNNPVKAGLVAKTEDWEYSSAKDVKSVRNGSLINREVIMEFGLTF
ncbi:transposase [Carboxylicivirga sp. N1Y90]|uniref:transposase n=1 Tax=Carboxylicivirga fragile TaxID=3417571 RepID=UPI003D3503A0|nr:transposase [Marinilabiliaceae bacterium N1Y90]